MAQILDFWWQLLICFIIVYLYSNVNFAIILSNRVKHRDIRKYGSGNPGTTNMLRTFGVKMGAFTFVLDCAKGALAAGIGQIVFGVWLKAGDPAVAFASYLLGLSAVLGHIFPVFINFKGGKGFATGVGFLAVLNPWFTLGFMAAAIVIVLVCDYMSLGAIFFFTAELIQLLIAFFLNTEFVESGAAWWTAGLMLLTWALIMHAHRFNITRLIKGRENKSNFKKMFSKKKREKLDEDKKPLN